MEGSNGVDADQKELIERSKRTFDRAITLYKECKDKEDTLVEEYIVAHTALMLAGADNIESLANTVTTMVMQLTEAPAHALVAIRSKLDKGEEVTIFSADEDEDEGDSST